ncbi:hypothetical protein GKR50_15865 [Providencia rustigianii]|uniref:hypothetical protein n=1 Tax=Providencia rustigianii TaxID=158850 RepID=UPI000F6E2EBC|nr:hypothetical protein [Providencia rustigianii]MTC61467.1 hypothetical protein [Providencia rustigianii]VEH56751.1 Uncharacterised protein [Providencia rustigianii]
MNFKIKIILFWFVFLLQIQPARCWTESQDGWGMFANKTKVGDYAAPSLVGGSFWWDPEGKILLAQGDVGQRKVQKVFLKGDPVLSWTSDKNDQCWINWTVLKNGASHWVDYTDGAMYLSIYSSYTFTRNIRISKKENEVVTVFLPSPGGNPSEPGFIYEVDGPSGVYKILSKDIDVYAFSAGSVPTLYVGARCDGDGVWDPVPSALPPLPPIEVETVCNFWLTDDELDLGTVDQHSAEDKYDSTNLSGECNENASVKLTVTPQYMDLGGLNIKMIFDDNYYSDTKKNWLINKGRIENTRLWAVVDSVDKLTPGEYKKTGVIYIEYQ